MVRALILFKPAGVPILFKVARSPMVCVPDRNLLSLYRDFLAICNTGDIPRIQQFYEESVCTHPAMFDQYYGPRIGNKALYSRFMGSVYCNVCHKSESDPVNRWFHGLATEIHNLY
jgi:hypothetical protein